MPSPGTRAGLCSRVQFPHLLKTAGEGEYTLKLITESTAFYLIPPPPSPPPTARIIHSVRRLIGPARRTVSPCPFPFPRGSNVFAEEIFEECPISPACYERLLNGKVGFLRGRPAREMMTEVGSESWNRQSSGQTKACHYFYSERRVNTFHNQMRTRPNLRRH